MCLSSEEGDARCMGIFPTRVRRLPTLTAAGERLKVPHVGWDTISELRTPLFDGMAEDTYVYYVHSFAAEPCAATVATTRYGARPRQLLRHAVPPRKERAGGRADLTEFPKPLTP